MILNREMKIVIVASLLCQSPLILAGDRMYQSTPSTTAAVTTTSTGTGTGTTTNNSALNTYNASSTPVPDTTAINNIGSNQANNILNQGQKASDKQGAGKAIGLASAAFSGAMAAVTCTQKPFNPQCPLWIMGAAAGLLVASKNGKAQGTSNQTVADVTGGTSTATPTPTPVEQGRDYTTTLQNLKDVASKAGISLNPKTLSTKLPDGRVISADALLDSNKLAGAGLSQGEIGSYLDGLQKSFKAGEKAVKGADKTKDGSSFEDGSGGGSKSAGSSGSSSDPGYSLPGQAPAARDPAQVAGLSRDFNGEKIGVASDNLFTLINRRYDHQANQNSFLLPKQ